MTDRNPSPIGSPAHSIQSVGTASPSALFEAQFSPAHESPLRPMHLQYFTWEQYADFSPPSEFFYEIVDGHMVYKEFDFADHKWLQDALLDIFDIDQRIRWTFPRTKNATLQIPPSRPKTLSFTGAAPSSSRDAFLRSPPLSPRSQPPSVRVADVVVCPPKDPDERATTSPSHSETSQYDREQTKIYSNEYAERIVMFPAGDLATFVFEVTSEGTRRIDFEQKWRDYADAGVRYYVILDVAPEEACERSVIVGSRERPREPGWEQSTTGDPRKAPLNPVGPGSHIVYYYKRFMGSDVVDVGRLKHFKLTADQWLSYEALRAYTREQREKEDKKQEMKLEEYRKRREKAEKEFEKHKKRREEAEKGIMEAQKRREEAQKGIMEAQKRREEAQKGIMEAQKRIMEAEKSVKEMKKTAEEVKKEIDDEKMEIEDEKRRTEDANEIDALKKKGEELERRLEDWETFMSDVERVLEFLNRTENECESVEVLQREATERNRKRKLEDATYQQPDEGGYTGSPSSSSPFKKMLRS